MAAKPGQWALSPSTPRWTSRPPRREHAVHLAERRGAVREELQALRGQSTRSKAPSGSGHRRGAALEPFDGTPADAALAAASMPGSRSGADYPRPWVPTRGGRGARPRRCRTPRRARGRPPPGPRARRGPRPGPRTRRGRTRVRRPRPRWEPAGAAAGDRPLSQHGLVRGLVEADEESAALAQGGRAEIARGAEEEAQQAWPAPACPSADRDGPPWLPWPQSWSTSSSRPSACAGPIRTFSHPPARP